MCDSARWSISFHHLAGECVRMCVHKVWGGKVEHLSPSFTCSVCECINQPERAATDILTLASTSTRTQTNGTVTTNWRPRLFAFHFMSLGFPLSFVLFVPSLLFPTSSRSCSCSFSHFFSSCNSCISDDKSTSHSHLLNISSLMFLRLSRILILVCQVPFLNALLRCIDSKTHRESVLMCGYMSVNLCM